MNDMTDAAAEVAACSQIGGWAMSDIVRSLSTSGLAPKKQLQTWSDALTDLCGQFDVDPLEGSSLEGRINYTTVSQLKLCQIEASQPSHRAYDLGHQAERASLRQDPVPDLRHFSF